MIDPIIKVFVVTYFGPSGSDIVRHVGSAHSLSLGRRLMRAERGKRSYGHTWSVAQQCDTWWASAEPDCARWEIRLQDVP